jgi:hypothetical protein
MSRGVSETSEQPTHTARMLQVFQVLEGDIQRAACHTQWTTNLGSGMCVAVDIGMPVTGDRYHNS